MQHQTDHSQEARILAKYLTNSSLEPSMVKLYAEFVTQVDPDLISKKDHRLMELSLNHSLLLPFIDAGLAITRPEAELRRRIYIMFSLLESQPDHDNLFVPSPKNPLYALVIIIIGAWAVLKAILGVLLLAVIRP